MPLPTLLVLPSTAVFGQPSVKRSDEGTSFFRQVGEVLGLVSGSETNVRDGEAQDPREDFSDTKIRARRPLRGIQIKEDTYCSLRIISDQGKKILQVDASGNEDKNGENPNLGRSFINTNFIAQAINEERVEKAQEEAAAGGFQGDAPGD